LTVRFRIGPGKDDHSLVIEGEIDIATADQVVSTIGLCSMPEGDIVVDCSRVTFLDAAGVRAFVTVAAGLPEGSRLVITGASGVVLQVLELLRAGQHPGLEIET
jgi:anti-anti-sigma factor